MDIQNSHQGAVSVQATFLKLLQDAVIFTGLRGEDTISLQSVLHDLAGVKSCFLKLSEELEWRKKDI